MCMCVLMCVRARARAYVCVLVRVFSAFMLDPFPCLDARQEEQNALHKLHVSLNHFLIEMQ